MEDFQVPPDIKTCELGDRSALTQAVFFYIQCCYAILASIFYLLIIFRIVKNQKSQGFSDSYFKIYVFDGVISLLLVFFDFGLTRPLIFINALCYTFLDLFTKPTYSLTWYLTLFNYLQFAKMFALTLLCANRFTAVVFPIEHKVFWKKYVNRILVFTGILPSFFTWQLAISPVTFDAYSGEGLLGYEHVVKSPWIRTRVFKICTSLLAFAFIVVSNIWIYRVTRKFKNKLKTLEYTLAISTIINSGVFLLFILVQGLLIIFPTSFLVEHLWLGRLLKKTEFICNDLYIMSSPVVLFILNKKLRTSLFKVAPVVPQNTAKPLPQEKVSEPLVNNAVNEKSTIFIVDTNAIVPTTTYHIGAPQSKKSSNNASE